MCLSYSQPTVQVIQSEISSGGKAFRRFILFLVFPPNLNLSVALPGSCSLCTKGIVRVDAHLSDCAELWEACWIRCCKRGKRKRWRERAPGKLPWLCLQQKAIVWCGRAAGTKAPTPTGCALGEMPDGDHCWMTSTLHTGTASEATRDWKNIEDKQRFSV